MSTGINVLSLFDGMSCGQVALQRAGIKVDKYFASEIKEDGIKVTKHNFPNTIHIGDVTKVKYNNGVLYTENGSFTVDIDLLIGGSPCQDLSVAMRDRNGLAGEKSRLFYEYLRVLNEVKPNYFLLENVARMSKEDKTVIDELMRVRPIRINSELTSAQLRDRLYWTNIPNVDQPKDLNIVLNDILENGWSDRIKSRCLLESDSRPLITPVKMFHRYFSTGFTTIVFKNKQQYKDCLEHYNKYFKGRSAKEIDSVDAVLDVYDGIRILNQTELEVLQNIPKGYTSILSRNNAAGVLGDGWTVDVIAHILKGLA